METKSEVQRKRRKHTRSRLGCRVCRIRRIRCDMTRPACVKCTSTGRQCEGYLQLEPIQSIAPSVEGAPNSDVTDTWEHRSLQYFQERTAPQFAGHFDIDFWSELILQVSAREPCIRHAIIALGSFHEAFQNNHVAATGSFNFTEDPQQRAYDHYTKAIALLNDHILTYSWAGLDISLLCCILCIGFEWLRGCYEAAETHLRNGLNILRQWMDGRNPSLNGIGVTFTSPTGHLIRSQIAPMFVRLALQARTFIDVPLPWTPALVDENPNRSSHLLKAARDDLNSLLSQQYLPSRSFTYLQSGSSSHKIQNSEFSNRLSKWYQDNAHCLSHSDLNALPNPASTWLNIEYTVLKILLATTHSYDQAQYDQYLSQFNHIIFLTESLSSMSSTSRFSIDIETVPVLYYVANKCRHPTTRRKAIALLKKDARREGLWDGISSARIAEEIVGIEEEGLVEVRNELDVPVARRVYKTKVDIDLEGRKIRLSYLRQGDEHWSVERILSW